MYNIHDLQGRSFYIRRYAAAYHLRFYVFFFSDPVSVCSAERSFSALKPRAQPILRFFFRTFFGEANPATFFSENVVREWQEQRGSM